MNTVNQLKNAGSSPKLLLTSTLPNTEASQRNIGQYLASTSMTHFKSNIFSEYLEENSNGTWKVLKSGYYLVYAEGCAHTSSTQVQIDAKLKVNNGFFVISRDRGSGVAAWPGGNLTIYIEKGSNIDFSHEISVSNATYNYGTFKISAMF